MGTGKAGAIGLLLILLALARIYHLTCGFDDMNGTIPFEGFGVSSLGDWIAEAFDVPAESVRCRD